jgi:hypothetical protein
MYLCASSMPPSKDIGGYLSEYVHNVAHGVSADSEVQVLALNTLNALKHAVKAGPRHTIPAREEIEALLTGRKLTTIVFFLDETFEEITYDMATTVADAVQVLLSLLYYYVHLNIHIYLYMYFFVEVLLCSFMIGLFLSRLFALFCPLLIFKALNIN